MSRENVTMIEITEITEVMNYIEGLSAVVFDLDDTLYSEKEYVRSGYKAVAEIISQVRKKSYGKPLKGRNRR